MLTIEAYAATGGGVAQRLMYVDLLLASFCKAITLQYGYPNHA